MSRTLRIILASVLLSALASCQTATTIEATKLSDQESTLIIAAANGDTNKVKEMLDAGVPVDTRDLDVGLTPLGHAAWFGHVETAQLLIERGADVNAKKKDGMTVLTLAKTRGHQPMVEMLIKAGAK